MLVVRQTPLAEDFETDSGHRSAFKEAMQQEQGVGSHDPYLPSPEEIKEQCREIRRSWSEAEYHKRSGHTYEPLEIAEVKDPGIS